MNAYAHKFFVRAEGIWQGQGLSLEGKDVLEHDGSTSISLHFHKVAPSQAELLVSQMSKAFRRANVCWKEDDNGLVVRVKIPPINT